MCWLAPTSAEAAAPRSELATLAGGTAILQYDGDRSAIAQRTRALGLRTVTFQRLSFMGVRGPGAVVRRAARLRAVRHAHMNRRLTYFLHESAPLVYGGRPSAAGGPWSQGYNGSGVNVAIVDSGVDGTHPDLEQRVVENYKVLVDWVAREDTIVECPSACDSDTTGGHGTHVAGIVAGDGTASSGYHTGVAPGAGIVGYSVGDGISVLWALAAFDHILAHPELGVRVVNNSWGDEDQRFDSTDPINVATKKLTEAGITVVFAAGNSSTGSRREKGYEGGSNCAPDFSGTCMINSSSVAPWVLSIGNTRKDYPGGPGDQPLTSSSSRGDPFPQKALSGETISYKPTLSAPGTNIWSAKDLTSAVGHSCGASAELPSCQPPPGRERDLAYYVSVSGTSMSAPHVAGAVAVLQSKAKALLGRFLSPAEAKDLLVSSAAPMTKPDKLWDWPCGSAAIFVGCGERTTADMTGTTYQDWQVGAGALDLGAALAALDAMAVPAAAPAPADPSPAPAEPEPAEPAPTPAPAEPAPAPSEPSPGESPPARTETQQRSTRTGGRRAAPKRRALKRCMRKAAAKRTKAKRRAARRACRRKHARR